ncbi:MAG: hypothetical protein AB1634_14595 [Thermodesulfobacteriota bacterium]
MTSRPDLPGEDPGPMALPIAEACAALLAALPEALLLCDGQARILFWSPATAALLRSGPPLAAGSSLYSYLERPPLEHAFRFLRLPGPPKGQVAGGEARRVKVLATAFHGQALCTCTVTALGGPPDGGVFALALARAAAPGQTGRDLAAGLETLRAPLANLRAAVENLASYPTMAAVMRSAFENVVAQETITLSHRFQVLMQAADSLSPADSLMLPVPWPDLLALVNQRRQERSRPALASSGPATALLVESHPFVVMLDLLAAGVEALRPARPLHWEMAPGERLACLDLVWSGEPLAAAQVDALLSTPLPETPGGQTVSQVAARHGCDPWSRGHRTSSSEAVLRLPIPMARGQEA